MATAPSNPPTPNIPIGVVGWSLGLFFAIAYTLCVIFDLLFPGQNMSALWVPLLPWVDGIGLFGYFLGVIELVAYGWLIAAIFGPLFNFFAARASR